MNDPSIEIAGRRIGDGYPVFVIAEAGANHNGDLALAKKLVTAARDLGADCIKFQTFTAELFCADKTKKFTYRSQGKEVTESEFEMFKRLEFTRAQWAELMAFCEKEGILFLTTVQDSANLAMMLELGLKGIKIGSDDFDHIINLRRYAATGLPLIVSKGMADLAETERVLGEIAPLASGGMAVLHCVSLYPCEPEFLNLNQIQALRARFPNLVWGFSDHSPSSVAPAVAVGLGARVIEKHFTLSHDLPGPDHWFSMDSDELGAMIANIRYTEKSLGSGEVRPSDAEQRSRKIMRRRVVARIDIPAGARLDESNVDFKRAVNGAFLGDWPALDGRKLRVAKRANEGIALDEAEG
jgi:sialic acid synthase SpsE